MNRINLLETRRAKLLSAGKEIREKIAALCDEGSFIEYDSYSYSKNEFYGEEAEGEGVITGFVTIEENPFYIVAQNGQVMDGGISKANCNKIVKCLRKAEKTGVPVLYLLNTLGMQAGEGVGALEGLASVLDAMADLRGNVTQVALVVGDVYGSFALVVAGCDYVITVKDVCVSYASPVVIGASANLTKEEVGGVKSQKYNNLVTCNVEDLAQAKAKICELVEMVYMPELDCEDDLGRETEALNEEATAEAVIKATFDEGKLTVLNKGFADEVITGLGRIGGTSVAAVVFDGGKDGVQLNYNNILKIKEFAYLAAENELPLVMFVNTLGLEQCACTNNTPVMKEMLNLIYALKQTQRVSVVYGKAIGLGYTLFAAKNLGVEYSFAFANGYIGLFNSKVGASVEFSSVKAEELDKLAEKYAEENQDPINAAKDGYVDNIIQPRHVRQYVISALQSL